MKGAAVIAATVLALVAGVASLAGCASYQEVELQEPDDMMPGPGLFSGEDGVFTIYSKDGARGGEHSDDDDM